MKLKLLFLSIVILSSVETLSMNVNAHTDYFQIKKGQEVVADVIRIEELSKLRLRLYDQNGLALKKFSHIQKTYPECVLNFAMNAGMYHANYSPVGLYIEQGEQKQKINTLTKRFGNFYMQPNGVLAWNNDKIILLQTQKYIQTVFKANYATQSGPMLVIDGKVNALFIPNSESLKVRNGVGVKNNQVYFVISRDRMSFYDFAHIFKNNLRIDQALYLDGSISSAYIPQAKRHDQIYNLGPIFTYSESAKCNF